MAHALGEGGLGRGLSRKPLSQLRLEEWREEGDDGSVHITTYLKLDQLDHLNAAGNRVLRK